MRFLRFVCSILCLILVVAPRSSALDWPPVSPEERAMKDLVEQPGAPAVILFREEVDDNPMHYHSTYVRMKILTEAGRRYADVIVPYDRHYQNVGSVNGQITHPDGSGAPFEGKLFDKVLVKGHNIQIHVKAFTLPDVQVGSIIDYRYYVRYDDHVFFPPSWMVQEDLFQKHAVFRFAITPKDLILEHGVVGNGAAWTSYLPKDHQPVFHTGGQAGFSAPRWPDVVDLDMSNIPAFIEEPFSPPASSLKYRVNFYYRVGGKTDEYWKTEGKYWNKEVEGFINRNKGVAEAASQTTAPTDTPEQKVRKIYAYISNLENQSFIPARAQQEQQSLGIKPNEGADDVVRQRSGNHDQLNRLFVSMVRSAGVSAFLMRVPDRSHTFFSPDLLSTNQFDAEIAFVRLDGKDVFLDPGTKFCPYGVLDWRYSASNGLRQSPAKTTELGPGSAPNYNQAIVKRFAKLKLTEQGTVEGVVGVGFIGLEAMTRRREAGRTDAEGRKKILEDEMRSWLPGNSSVVLINQPDWESTEAPLLAEFHITSPLAVSAGRRWLLSPHVFQFNQKPLFPSAQRSNSVYFYYPSREIDEVHITLPATTELESVPPDDTVRESDYALYSTQQKREEPRGIVSKRDLAMGGLLFPVTEYKNLRDFYNRVKADDDQPLILKAAGNVASQ